MLGSLLLPPAIHKTLLLDFPSTVLPPPLPLPIQITISDRPMDGSDPPLVRCRNCAGPLSKELQTSRWCLSPFTRESVSAIGTFVGGITSGFYGYNIAMPIAEKYVKGPNWLRYLVGSFVEGKSSKIYYLPTAIWSLGTPVALFSTACAGLAGGAFPAVTQLVYSSYHAAITPPSKASSHARDSKTHKSTSSSTV